MDFLSEMEQAKSSLNPCLKNSLQELVKNFKPMNPIKSKLMKTKKSLIS